METLETSVLGHAVLCFIGFFFFLVIAKEIKDKIKSKFKKRLLIVEDSKTEREVIKYKVNLDEYRVEWKSSVEDISRISLYLLRPDRVYVDQHLGGTMKGAELVKYYESLGVDVRLATADDNEIPGISEDHILRKSEGDLFYNKLAAWMNTKLNVA